MKNIYFVQVGFEFDGSVYLPYAVGTIVAYCQKNSEIKNEYAFPDIIYKREKLSEALEKIVEPYMVGFSCNVWNMEYNKALASIIKEKYPDCTIVFGGHSVNENAELLKSEEYIDILIFGEGERVFEEMLLEQLNSEWALGNVKNIAYRCSGKVICTERSYCDSLENYPSPYTEGVFDELIRKNRDCDFLGVLETNRGCPYNCAYCDWCVGKKMRFFPMEKVLSEIKWLSENRIEYCFCADSNFGMFDRDIDIAKALVEVKTKSGYPQVFRPCYEKNSDERVFEICSLLNKNGLDKGATMAYQTLSDEALENIGRKNLTMEHFSGLMKKYDEAGISTYSELILGLPGETKDSFCRGICRLFENGQHNSVSVYHCEVLPNSRLALPEYIEEHGVETIKVAFNHIHSAPKRNDEVKEYSYIVRSTATLSREDWVYANLFSVCVQCFHSLGLLRFFAMYLHNENIVLYYNFYTKLLDYIMKGDGLLSRLWKSFQVKYKSSLEGDWNYYKESFGNVTWFFEEGAFLEFICNYESCFDEIYTYLRGFDIDEDIFSELLKYQKAMVRKPNAEKVTVELKYDFDKYFNSIIKGESTELESKKNVLKITPDKEFSSFAAYAKETVWYGRRRGRAVYSRQEAIIL